MKRIVVLTALLAIALQAYAQHFDPEHRHSIEISSGIPPIHCSLLGTHSGSIEMDPTYGYRENSLLYSVINIGYTYAISEKWDFNFVFNLSSRFYTYSNYPIVPAGTAHTSGQVYDYDLVDTRAEPESSGPGVDLWPSYMFDFRWKWYRSDAIRLYSSFGLSYLPMRWPIYPNFTPIGINFGRKHVYGIAEMSFSTAATLLLVGVGYRF